MRQVPEHKIKFSYLIVGSGKLSKHLQNYFSLKNISFKVWNRHSNIQFESLALDAKYILVLISDDEIVEFIKEHKSKPLEEKIWIHCSGMLSTSLAESAHPLMTFMDSLYSLETYESISFITERNRKIFKDLFPDLQNKSYEINKDEKVFYHAMCVLSGNFTAFIWKYFFDYLKSQDISESAAKVYLKAVAENLISSDNPLTGPIQRNDVKVIEKHNKALNGHPIANVYLAFLDAYNKMKKEKMIEIN
ncbi:MAG TPA: hypothetical protein DHV28_01150 [Ignavibacteriales bacterium]|nr:hypothetical protein [Ignavibacteriales bacterium]